MGGRGAAQTARRAVSAAAGRSGGVENALVSLSGKLKDQGHQVTIYVIQKTGAFLDKVPDGVLLRQIPMDEKLRGSIPVGGTVNRSP